MLKYALPIRAATRDCSAIGVTILLIVAAFSIFIVAWIVLIAFLDLLAKGLLG